MPRLTDDEMVYCPDDVIRQVVTIEDSVATLLEEFDAEPICVTLINGDLPPGYERCVLWEEPSV